MPSKQPAKLTKRQSQIMKFIVERIRDDGYAPSYREIGENLGVSSTATIHEHIKNLEEKGLLQRDWRSARSIQVAPAVMRETRGVSLQLAGLITAGEPIEAIEEQEQIDVPARLVADPANTYVLRVKGNSMIEDGINSGDYVIVERRNSARDGEVVVALLENMYATLKRFYKEKGRVRLQPANRTMSPIYATDVAIQGVVRGLIRDFHAA